MFYIVVYSNYDCPYDIVGIFTDKLNAEKCQEYYERLTAKNDYGDVVEIVEMLCDDVDYNAKIFELEEKEQQEKQAKEDAIKRTDLEEFNRIKEKYGL